MLAQHHRFHVVSVSSSPSHAVCISRCILQAHFRAYCPVSVSNKWVAEQAAECSHGLTPGRSARQAGEVEKRNAPAGSNTTPELANDATGAALVALQ